METNEGIVNMGELLKVTQSTAMSVSGLSEQMGLVVNKVNENLVRIVDLEDRMERRERSETVNPTQKKFIKRAVSRRVYELLELKSEDGKLTFESKVTRDRYSPLFYSRLYRDARRDGKMGDPYDATLNIDYDEVMKFVTSWVPAGGPGALKAEADENRRARELAKQA